MNALWIFTSASQVFVQIFVSLQPYVRNAGVGRSPPRAWRFCVCINLCWNGSKLPCVHLSLSLTQYAAWSHSLICLHQGTAEVATYQCAVCFWRISTCDIWGVEGHSQVLCHVGGFWLTGHVVPRQALLRIDLRLAHVIVSPGGRVVLHGMCHAGAHGLKSEQ